jgi:multidrug efflux pump subunit AcrA (membrane-fusion protein)
MAILKTKPAFLLALLAGITLAVALVKSKPPMMHESNAEKAVPVDVIALKQFNIAPTITGYGVVEPNVLLQVKAEVSAAISYIHPQLRKGELILKDTVVLRLDDQDYQLASKQAKADAAASKANLKELELNTLDVKARLALAQEKLTLGEKELARKKSLLAQNTISQSSVDTQFSTVIQLKQEVQNLNNQLLTLPYQREVLQAKIAIAEAAVETQTRNLARTEIRMPFDGRITELNVEEKQFASLATPLFSTQTIDKVLINVQLPVERFRSLIRTFKNGKKPFAETILTYKASTLFEMLGVEAEVRMTDNALIRWPAKVERISDNLDPKSRTLGIIVSVENPYKMAEPGSRPPLIAHMYTEVIIRTQPRPFFVIPRDALHEGKLYSVKTSPKSDSDNTRSNNTQANNTRSNNTQASSPIPGQLEKITLSPDYQFGEIALFKQGLHPDQLIIVSDLFPAISNMKVNAILDAKTEANIQQWVKEN